MWRSKKLIVGVVLAAVILAGGIGGVVLADDNENGNQPGALFGALWDRVCGIYYEKTGDTIDQNALQEAVAEARGELRDEALQNRPEMDCEAMKECLDALLAEEKITEEQYLKMKDRMESMPDKLPGFGFRGMRGMCGFGGPCSPTE